MKRIMVRLDDDLYTRIFETAHEERVSMNQLIVDLLDDRAYSHAVLQWRRDNR